MIDGLMDDMIAFFFFGSHCIGAIKADVGFFHSELYVYMCNGLRDL